jgi:hypothetical protein
MPVSIGQDEKRVALDRASSEVNVALGSFATDAAGPTHPSTSAMPPLADKLERHYNMSRWANGGILMALTAVRT